MKRLIYFPMAGLYLLFVLLAVRYFPALSFFWASVVVFIFALPPSLAALYYVTVNKLEKSMVFKRQGIAYRLITGRLLWALFIFSASLLSTWLFMVKAAFSGFWDWFFLFLGAVTYYFIFNRLKIYFYRELKAPLVNGKAAFFAALLNGALLTFFCFLFLKSGLLGFEVPSSVGEAVEAEKARVLPEVNDETLNLIFEIAALLFGVKKFFYGKALTLAPGVFYGLVALSNFASFFHYSLTLSLFAVGSRELSRVFRPISINAGREKLSLRIALSYFSVFIAVGALFYHYFYPEAQRLPELSAYVYRVEKIIFGWGEEGYYRPGTLAQIEALREEYLSRLEEKRQEAVERLERNIDEACSSIKGRVDNFLDWYYSLKADYLRLAKLATGQYEKFVEEKLKEILKPEDALASIDEEVSRINEEIEALREEYRDRLNAILEANRVSPGDGAVIEVVRQAGYEDLMSLEPDGVPHFLDFETRLTASAVVGVSAGVTAGVLTRKKLSKALSERLIAHLSRRGIVSGIARALSKLVARRATAKAAGAVAGGVLGGVAGVATGVLAGIGADYAILKADELMNRDKFTQKLVASIDDYCGELKLAVKQGM